MQKEQIKKVWIKKPIYSSSYHDHWIYEYVRLDISYQRIARHGQHWEYDTYQTRTQKILEK